MSHIAWTPSPPHAKQTKDRDFPLTFDLIPNKAHDNILDDSWKLHSDKKILIQNVKTFSSGTNAQTF